MEKRVAKLNNCGLSLVELLVAVAILGLALVPIFSSFSTSARIAASSRKQGEATAAAQNVAEGLETYHISTLAESFLATARSVFSCDSVQKYTFSGGEYSPDTAELTEGAGNYYLGINGLKSGKSRFDALITMSADAYSDINNAPVAVYTPMDAVFSQPGGISENPDRLAAREMADTATALSSTLYSESDFTDRMARKILIRLLKDEEKKDVTVVARYSYSAKISYNVTERDENGVPVIKTKTETLTEEYSYEFFHSRYMDEKMPISALYFFYYPCYMNGAGFDDNITVENSSNMELKLFLIKQRRSGMEAYDSTYSASVSLKESGAYSAQRVAVHTNMNTDLVSGQPISNIFEIKVYKGMWYHTGSFSPYLVESQIRNRMYSVNIRLFEEGADFNSDKPIMELDSSKLD